MSKPIKKDENAKPRTPGQAAFLSKPEGAPVYYGFPLIEETRTDGWCFGAITEFIDPDGCREGDGFVEAPDGSRAGLVWSVGNFSPKEISPPQKSRWGVYAVSFPKPIFRTDDLVAAFRTLLPNLKEIFEKVSKSSAS